MNHAAYVIAGSIHTGSIHAGSIHTCRLMIYCLLLLCLIYTEFHKDGKYDLDFKNKASDPSKWVNSYLCCSVLGKQCIAIYSYNSIHRW